MFHSAPYKSALRRAKLHFFRPNKLPAIIRKNGSTHVKTLRQVRGWTKKGRIDDPAFLLDSRLRGNDKLGSSAQDFVAWAGASRGACG
jgi:hypothetical protein